MEKRVYFCEVITNMFKNEELDKKEISFTDEAHFWYGGEPGRRLASQEKPLEIQDQFLQRLGYQEVSRRARLGVDPELRHLVGFHVGPASPLPDLTGYSRCGYTLVLKGLVFPQWKRRPLAVIGSRLFLYPGKCPTRESANPRDKKIQDPSKKRGADPLARGKHVLLERKQPL
ncbi:PH domain leucine-rich repeat-containing protein phosphatase [Ooceraea biroi]|uniref:PH domain leucine-rich repeat-containing protein phosphatase n=1 Tax=Ooceraea biroi TaxID=2015173 RepID=A0A026W276_OOCBI|nr:PH domain leucine-rich repeat-containing protein phosphatase [Ooceraea biroi]